MRRERLYLLDILEAADAIRKFLDGVEEASFLRNDRDRSGPAAPAELTGAGDAGRLTGSRRRVLRNRRGGRSRFRKGSTGYLFTP